MCILDIQTIVAQPYPEIYAVANPIRGLVDSKRSEEHLKSSNVSIKNKTRQNRQKERKLQHEKTEHNVAVRTARKQRGAQGIGKIKRMHGLDDSDSIHKQGYSLERVWYIGSHEPSDTPLDRNY